MANLTLTVDADLIRRARVRAIQEGTSLSAKVREFLTAGNHLTDLAVMGERGTSLRIK